MKCKQNVDGDSSANLKKAILALHKAYEQRNKSAPMSAPDLGLYASSNGVDHGPLSPQGGNGASKKRGIQACRLGVAPRGIGMDAAQRSPEWNAMQAAPLFPLPRNQLRKKRPRFGSANGIQSQEGETARRLSGSNQVLHPRWKDLTMQGRRNNNRKRPREQAIDCLCFADLSCRVGDHGALLLQQLGRNLPGAPIAFLPIQVNS